MLREWSDGKPEALDKLLPLVYDELHRQAASLLRKERPGHTLQTTALIDEAYLKLIVVPVKLSPPRLRVMFRLTLNNPANVPSGLNRKNLYVLS
jgi:hypothetical protein